MKNKKVTGWNKDIFYGVIPALNDTMQKQHRTPFTTPSEKGQQMIEAGMSCCLCIVDPWGDWPLLTEKSVWKP